ncbi:drug resistance transporter, EmrB/QacA subfamily [Modestobacter sp. DSM 44400]|nr:drug resistance transporter, EmrB/QacA subfamily [Modestobacter sp. DSM 44400]
MCVSALSITLLDVSIVTVALPSIGTGLDADAAELQWVVSGYALAFGMVPIIGGRLGDDRGRKRMLMVGIGAFVVFSAMVGVAPTPGVVIVGRVLQGLAGGLINPQVSGLVQQLFPRPERGRAFGVIGAAVGIATAAGPVVGGVIIGLGGETNGWRLCFLINVPIGVVALVLCAWLLPTEPTGGGRRALDLPGAALLTVGVFGLLFPAVQYDASHDLRLAVLVVPALAVLAGFVAWERGPGRRRGHPLIDLDLFGIRSYADGVVLALLFFIAYTGTPLVLVLFLQDGLGYSALQSGLTASAYAVGTAVSAPIAGRLLRRAGQKVLVVALLLFTVGIASAAGVAALTAGTVAPGHVALFLAPALLVAGLGGGAVMTPNQALSLAEVDVRGGSTAGGMLQTSQRIGNAAGAAVMTAIFYAAATGAAADGLRRQEHYGSAYTAALAFSVVVALAALGVAIRDVRRRPIPTGTTVAAVPATVDARDPAAVAAPPDR